MHAGLISFSLIPQIYHKYCILKVIFDVMQIFYFLVPADQTREEVTLLCNIKKLSYHASFLEKVVGELCEHQMELRRSSKSSVWWDSEVLDESGLWMERCGGNECVLGHNPRGVVVFKNFEMFLGCEIEPSSVSLFVCNDM